MTAAETAKLVADEIQKLHDIYLLRCRELNTSRDSQASKEAYERCLQSMYDAGSALHQKVEAAIVQLDVIRHPSELWAKDLASTAVNVLDVLPAFYGRLREDGKSLNKTTPEPSPQAFYAMQCAVVAYHPNKVEQLQKEFTAARLPIYGFTNPAHMNTKFSKSEWVLIFSTGLALLLLMLSVALFSRSFNNLTIWIVRVCVSLAAAMLAGTALPGLIEIESRTGRNLLRATGAFAVLVLVFYINPPALVVNAVNTNEQYAPK